MSRAYMGTGGTGGLRDELFADQVDDRSKLGILPDREATELRFPALVLGCRESSDAEWTDGGLEEFRPMLLL